MLQGAGLQVTAREGAWEAVPPTHRFDLSIEEDLVEELARMHGYDNIAPALPQVPVPMLARPEARASRNVLRSVMVSRDYQEIVGYSFVDAAWERDFCANDAPEIGRAHV